MTRFVHLADVCALWKSVAEAGRAIGVEADLMRKYATGARRFPVEKIDDLVRAAQSRPDGAGVTHELIVRLASEAKGRRSSAAQKQASRENPASAGANADEVCFT